MTGFFNLIRVLKKIAVCLIFACGSGVCIFGLMNIREAAAYKRYPSTSGFVIDSAVIKSHSSREKDLYELNIVYEYALGETPYYSTSVSSFGYDLFNESKAAYNGQIAEMTQILDKFPAPSSVLVHYNPEQPQDSVIDPDLKVPVLMPLIFGIILLLTSIHLYLFSSIFSVRKVD